MGRGRFHEPICSSTSYFSPSAVDAIVVGCCGLLNGWLLRGECCVGCGEAPRAHAACASTAEWAGRISIGARRRHPSPLRDPQMRPPTVRSGPLRLECQGQPFISFETLVRFAGRGYGKTSTCVRHGNGSLMSLAILPHQSPPLHDCRRHCVRRDSRLGLAGEMRGF